MAYKHHEMITVGGRFQPLVNGCNTIRKLSPKYETLQPGDTVTMSYVTEDTPVARAQPIAVEQLIVKSVAKSGLPALCIQFWRDNHARVHSSDALYELLMKIYGTSNGDFIAITFL